jgi:hypothetical protein
MPRPSGLPKTGGRKPGTPNKRTEMLSDALACLDCDVPSKLIQLLPQLTPEKQATVLLGLMPYLYPKRTAIELDQNDNQLVYPNKRPASVALPDNDISHFGVFLEIMRMTPEERIAHGRNLHEKMELIDKFENED